MTLSSKLIAIILVAFVVASWIGVGAFYVLARPGVAQWTLAVTAAAVVTEVAFWAGAAHFGLRALKNRREMFTALMRLVRRGSLA